MTVLQWPLPCQVQSLQTTQCYRYHIVLTGIYFPFQMFAFDPLPGLSEPTSGQRTSEPVVAKVTPVSVEASVSIPYVAREVPRQKRLFSSELEEKWLQSDEQFSVQVPRKNATKVPGMCRSQG